jgi:predicted AlkP superfamily phosphohydrolase/phosphomutase
MNGVLISGFVAVDFERSVYPKSLVGPLVSLGYRLDVDSRKAHESMDAFLEDLDQTLEARIRACHYLRSNEDWQTFMIVFTGTDRLMHFLWNAYEDEGHAYHEHFVSHFRKIDEAIGEIVADLTDEDLLVLHSDHGFERIEKDIYVNHALQSHGFLRLDQNSSGLEAMDGRTSAFALDPGRIYLHRKGVYSRGTVEDSDAEKLLTEIAEMFLTLEVDGRKVIRAAHRKEDIYQGSWVAQAPDLVLTPSEGFNLRAKPQAHELAQESFFTGKHTQDNGFLLVRNLADPNIVPEQPTVCDIRSILESHRSRQPT